METKTAYILEKLTQDSVNIIIQTYIDLNGQKYVLEQSRIAYLNSPSGRIRLVEFLPEEYSNTVMTLWGNAPTIQDPEFTGPIEE